VVRQPLAVIATVAIIIVGKSVAALLIVRAFGHPWSTAATISASLAQIGEFSFILAGLGVDLGLLSEEGRALILAGALISILLNPVLFVALDRFGPRVASEDHPATEDAPSREAPAAPGSPTGHAVLIGHGRVGRLVSERLKAAGIPLVVIEENEAAVRELQDGGVSVIVGNAAEPGALERAGTGTARWLISGIPDAFEGGALVERARAANPTLRIVARAHSDEEVAHLLKLGADLVIMGEAEIARGICEDIIGASARPVDREDTVGA
jgi:CPA2 family monovalent cation:H+ antiporter-2